MEPPAAASSPPPGNRAPFIAIPLPDLVYGTALHPFSFDVSRGGTTFVDPDGDPLSYDLTFPPDSWVTTSGPLVLGTPPERGSVQVSAFVTDGRGGSVHATLNVRIDPNGAPQIARPIEPLLVLAGQPIDFDVTQGGTTFTDPDGDSISYELTLASESRGLAIDGTLVVGALADVGAVNFRVTARDDYGGRSEEAFAIAVVAPEPGEPVLPATSYVYADEQLSWPRAFLDSSERVTPFFDRSPPNNRTTNAGATLGRVLFYDKRLSLTHTHSCASCHLQAFGFATPERFSTGVPGVRLTRNTMGLANVRYNYGDRYFSDQRAVTLESLVLMPIEEPNELDNTLGIVEQRIRDASFYPPLFVAAGLTNDRNGVARALAQFLRAMVAHQSKFDRAFSQPLSGNYTDPATVLTPLELRGALLFGEVPASENVGCTFCHSSGVQTVPFAMNTGLDLVAPDIGAGSGDFRAASLRNIAVTGPYMHDGRFATLREVIDHYDHGVVDTPQLSPRLRLSGPNPVPVTLGLSEEDKLALEAFLHTLTDESMLTDPRFSDPFPDN